MSELPPDTLNLSSAAPGQTILVVDDEVLIRLVVSEYLRECGYRVHEAANADEAMAVLGTPEVRIDLVFADVSMPQGSMDGFSLAHWIRANHPEVKVVLTSGAERSAQIAGQLCEAGPLMRKPYPTQHVVDRIKALLSKAERPSVPVSRPKDTSERAAS